MLYLKYSFPVLLGPNPDIEVSSLEGRQHVRIYWDKNGWYIRNSSGKLLFSFDLPQELFNLYADSGILSQKRALDLKQQMMHEFQAYVVHGGMVTPVYFILDGEWIESLRKRFV